MRARPGLEGPDAAVRLAMLPSSPAGPLEAYRGALDAEGRPVPHFDPLDGGAAARCLILLETPGAGMGPDDIVSRDNPTGTGRNLRCFCEAAGLAREETLLWNVVPWIVQRAGTPNRPVRRAEVADGIARLPELLALLPRLRVVVLAGRPAGSAAPGIASVRPDLALLPMPHPSPTIVCTSPTVGERIATTLATAARIIAQADDGERVTATSD